MHRSFTIAVAAEITAPLLGTLSAHEGVITVAVHPGAALRPPGDLISVVALNTAADAIIAEILDAADGEAPAIITATVDSVLYPPRQGAVVSDHDEATWEEAATAMRRHSRPNLNLALLALAGAVLSVSALTSSSQLTQAVALVAAGILTPSFEPLGRLALGLVTRHRAMVRRAAVAAGFTYLVVVVGALTMMLLLRGLGGDRYVADVLGDRTFREIQHPPAITLAISAAGAVAGVISVAAGRFTAMAGALVALQLMPALAATGIALEFGRWALAAQSLGRAGIDVAMVLIAGGLVFSLKHRTVHERRAPVH